MSEYEFNIAVTVDLDDDDEAGKVIGKLEDAIVNHTDGLQVIEVEAGDWYPVG